MVTCWERADLLAFVSDVYCIFVTFPCGILGQVWFLIVLFPDLCHLSYFQHAVVQFLSIQWVGTGVCEIEFSHMSKNSRNLNRVCKNISPLIYEPPE